MQIIYRQGYHSEIRNPNSEIRLRIEGIGIILRQSIAFRQRVIRIVNPGCHQLEGHTVQVKSALDKIQAELMCAGRNRHIVDDHGDPVLPVSGSRRSDDIADLLIIHQQHDLSFAVRAGHPHLKPVNSSRRNFDRIIQALAGGGPADIIGISQGILGTFDVDAVITVFIAAVPGAAAGTAGILVI